VSARSRYRSVRQAWLDTVLAGSVRSSSLYGINLSGDILSQDKLHGVEHVGGSENPAGRALAGIPKDQIT